MDRVQFDGVSKRYRLGQGSTNAREAIAAATRRLLTRRQEPAQEVWPLRNVSFHVGEGRALGVIGPNGAGKSTILKIVAGITSPTSGVARTRGRVAALLEIGTGFHPELSGRENVFLNGAILGMTRRDLASRFDEIVAFAGVERFLDTPVKRYSSGMYLRLAFAVAAHLDPDVLVVDEVLAVGDAEFQRRCLGHLAEAESDGRTVLYVSHDLESLARLCPQSLWLDAGQVRVEGPTAEVVRAYLGSTHPVAEGWVGSAEAGRVVLEEVRVEAAQGSSGAVLMRDEPFRIEVAFDVGVAIPGLDVAIYVTTSQGVRALDEVLSDYGAPALGPGRHLLEMEVPPLLNAGDFSVGIWIGTAYEQVLDVAAAAQFTLHGSHQGRPDRIIVARLPMSVRAVPER